MGWGFAEESRPHFASLFLATRQREYLRIWGDRQQRQRAKTRVLSISRRRGSSYSKGAMRADALRSVSWTALGRARRTITMLTAGGPGSGAQPSPC